jgi:hypothetical protein
MREDDYTRDEAGARDHAAILGASEWIGGDQAPDTTPYCSVCQRGTGGYVCGPCARDAAAYESPAYWCPACKTPHYVGTPEDRCVDCGHEGPTP